MEANYNKLKKIKINNEDSKTFKDLLLNNLKKQLEQFKQKNKKGVFNNIRWVA